MPVPFEGMNNSEKLNPMGAYVLLDYYTDSISRKDHEKKIMQPVFCVDSPRDIPIIMHCAREEGIAQFGMIVVAGGRHRTPVVIDRDQVYIMESLGVEKSKVGRNSVAQIALAVSKFSPDLSIHCAAPTRQVDSVSCGTDAFMALKETLRQLKNGREIFESAGNPVIYSKEHIIDKPECEDDYFIGQAKVHVHPAQPPFVAKYTQSQTLLAKSPYKYHAVQYGDQTTETLLEYGLRHKKTVSRETGDTYEIDSPSSLSGSNSPSSLSGSDSPSSLSGSDSPSSASGRDSTSSESENASKPKIQMKKMQTSDVNAAVAQRRGKHKRIMQDYAGSLTPKTAQDLIIKATGADLVTKHARSVPEEFMYSKRQPDGRSTEEILRDYAMRELTRTRPNDDSAIAPPPEMNVSDLVYAAKQKPSHKPRPK